MELNTHNAVQIWWLILFLVSAFNIVFWLKTKKSKFSGVKLKSLLRPFQDPRSIIWFSGLYVFGCAFRSILPRADVQKICLFDTWLSSVLVGRTVATIAELAFVLQWGLTLFVFSHAFQSNLGSRISQIIIPFIIVAETCSWYAVITTHYLGNVIEESLWGITYILIAIALLDLYTKVSQNFKKLVGAGVLGCILYVIFMFTIDVPMYISRLFEDQSHQKKYLNFSSGLYELATNWTVTYSLDDWQTEIPWMTLYFSAAVWVSIGLCHLPLQSKLVKSMPLQKRSNP